MVTLVTTTFATNGGDDTIIGGTGTDTIIGGPGKNTITTAGIGRLGGGFDGTASFTSGQITSIATIDPSDRRRGPRSPVAMATTSSSVGPAPTRSPAATVMT